MEGVLCARVENGAALFGVLGNVDVVGDRLRFQTEARALAVVRRFALLMQSVARIELYGGHIGVARHANARLGAFRRGVLHIGAAGVAQNVAMIVSVPLFQVDVVRIDRLADGTGRGEIEGRERDAAESADGDHRGIGGRDAVALDLQNVVENAAVALAVEVEIRVIGQVDRRLFIGYGMVENTELAILEDISHADVERPGIVLFAVGRDDGQAELVPHHLVFPDLFVEPDFAAVQVVAAVVAVELILRAVDREFALADAVAEPPDERAEIAAVLFVPRHVVIAEDDVRRRAVLGGHDDALNDAAQIENGRSSLAVDEIEDKHFLPVLRLSEYPACDHAFPSSARWRNILTLLTVL